MLFYHFAARNILAKMFDFHPILLKYIPAQVHYHTFLD